jgi:pilus assembly protein CpaF
MEDIFVFEREGISPGGRVLGRFKGTGYRPHVAQRIKAYGTKLDDAIFDEVREVVD